MITRINMFGDQRDYSFGRFPFERPISARQRTSAMPVSALIATSRAELPQKF